jgi:hypothetical protein
MSLFIVIPGKRVFAEGGPLNGEANVFGFYTKDGMIPLAPGNEVIVFAVGEAKGQIAFDFKKISSTDKHRIILEPGIVTKEQFNTSVKKFSLNNASIKASDSKNADEISKGNKTTKSGQELLKSYLPKKCDCSCGEINDSSRLIRVNSATY